LTVTTLPILLTPKTKRLSPLRNEMLSLQRTKSRAFLPVSWPPSVLELVRSGRSRARRTCFDSPAYLRKPDPLSAFSANFATTRHERPLRCLQQVMLLECGRFGIKVKCGGMQSRVSTLKASTVGEEKDSLALSCILGKDRRSTSGWRPGATG
jgi:hypothetical protein